MKYDLHCHSNHSDGDLSPKELIELASKSGISNLALTDHDTLNGLKEARLAAKREGLKLINGVELSCTWRGQLLHIVALGVNEESATLVEGVNSNQELRHQRARAMLDDLKRHDIEIEQELNSVLNGAVPTRPHFAQALINLGYVKNKQKAFKKFLVKGKPGFVEIQWPSLEEIGSWISASGGVGVLAHPLRYNLSRTKLITLVDEMKMFGIDGIEVSTANTGPQQIDMLAAIAMEKDLYASIGSDFHSLDQPWARLGSAPELPTKLKPVWQKLNNH